MPNVAKLPELQDYTVDLTYKLPLTFTGKILVDGRFQTDLNREWTRMNANKVKIAAKTVVPMP
jgi:hypothetical protein